FDGVTFNFQSYLIISNKPCWSITIQTMSIDITGSYLYIPSQNENIIDVFSTHNNQWLHRYVMPYTKSNFAAIVFAAAANSKGDVYACTFQGLYKFPFSYSANSPTITQLVSQQTFDAFQFADLLFCRYLA